MTKCGVRVFWTQRARRAAKIAEYFWWLLDAEGAEVRRGRGGFSVWIIDGIKVPWSLRLLAFSIIWNLKGVIARRPGPTWRSLDLDTCAGIEIATVAALLRNDRLRDAEGAKLRREPGGFLLLGRRGRGEPQRTQRFVRLGTVCIASLTGNFDDEIATAGALLRNDNVDSPGRGYL
jgi:hypothetical protein